MTDLSGDSGAIGRLIMGGTKDEPQMQVDLKGELAGWLLLLLLLLPLPPPLLLTQCLPAVQHCHSRGCSSLICGWLTALAPPHAGVLYNATIVPCAASLAVVNMGQAEAKVEALFSEFVQLRCALPCCAVM